MIRGSKVTFARSIPLHKNRCLRLGRSISLHRNRCFCVCTFVFVKTPNFFVTFSPPRKSAFWGCFFVFPPTPFSENKRFWGTQIGVQNDLLGILGRPETDPKPSAGPERPGDPKRTPKEAQRGPKGPQTDPWDPKIVSKVTQK